MSPGTQRACLRIEGLPEIDSHWPNALLTHSEWISGIRQPTSRGKASSTVDDANTQTLSCATGQIIIVSVTWRARIRSRLLLARLNLGSSLDMLATRHFSPGDWACQPRPDQWMSEPNPTRLQHRPSALGQLQRIVVGWCKRCNQQTSRLLLPYHTPFLVFAGRLFIFPRNPSGRSSMEQKCTDESIFVEEQCFRVRMRGCALGQATGPMATMGNPPSRT